MECVRDEVLQDTKLRLGWRGKEHVHEFIYLVSLFIRDGKREFGTDQ